MSSRRGFLGTVIGGAAGAAMTGAASASAATAASRARVRGANERVRFGLIGVGSRGKEILKAAMGCPNVEAAAVADVFTRRLDEARAIAPGAATHRDYRALLDDRTIDAVLIATPQHLHAIHFVAAIQAEKDVYQEKTMAFTPNHGRRMRNALEGTGRIVQVGMQMNSSEGLRTVREHVKANDVGDLALVQTHHFRDAAYGGWLRDVPPDCDPEHIDWEAFQGEAKHVPFDPQRYINWRFFWDYSGGNVFENMVHTLAFWFAGLDLSIPESVTSTGANYRSPKMHVPDTFQVAMSHPEKVLLTFTSMFGNGYYGEGRDLLFGTKGTLTRSRGDEIEMIAEGGKRSAPKPRAGGRQDVTALHMQNFFDCVRSRSEPNCPFEMGFRTSIACRMAVESYRRGTTVRWDPTTENIV